MSTLRRVCRYNRHQVGKRVADGKEALARRHTARQKRNFGMVGPDRLTIMG